MMGHARRLLLWLTCTVVSTTLSQLAHARRLPDEWVAWEPLHSAPAPPELAPMLPPGALLVVAGGGELLRFHGGVGASPPSIGRLWRSGIAWAHVDESDLLTRDRGTYRYAVPLGSHEAVVISLPKGAVVERARPRDPGSGWEDYEDELVDWARKAQGGRPPIPPSTAALGAWLETRGATALLNAAGAWDKGGRQVALATALQGVALARPLVPPFYWPKRVLLSRQRVGAGTRTLTVTGPAFLRVAVTPLQRAAGTHVGLRMGGLLVAGGPVPSRPGADATHVAWVPPGSHALDVTVTGGDVEIRADLFHKRHHLADALSGDESIDQLAFRSMSAAAEEGPEGALVHAEAHRLALDIAAARRLYAPLVLEDLPRPVRAMAMWRLGELSPRPPDAERFFQSALEQATLLRDQGRDAVTAIERARARRRVFDGQATPPRSSRDLWAEAQLFSSLAGTQQDGGAGVAGLAAIATVPLVGDSEALRRAYFDHAIWIAAQPAAPRTVSVLSLAPSTGRCEWDPSGGVYLVDRAPVGIEIVPDPLGTDRFRSLRVLAQAGSGSVLDAGLELRPEGGGPAELIPLPVIRAVEEHQIALAPGRHLLSTKGSARYFLSLPPGIALASAGRECPRYRRREYRPVTHEASAMSVQAAPGAIVGLELRLLSPTSTEIVTARLEVDGTTRTVRYLARPDSAALAPFPGRLVAAAVVVDFVAKDPGRLGLARHDDGPGTLLVRPLVRVGKTAGTSPLRNPTPSLPEIRAKVAAARAIALRAPGDTVAKLRGIGMSIMEARTKEDKAERHLARAVLLSTLGRFAFAEEDLLAAAELETRSAAVYQALLDEQRRYTDPLSGHVGYALDPTAQVLYELKGDPLARALAARAYSGDMEPQRRLLARTRADFTVAPAPALALVARFGDEIGDPAGAAAAYAELSRRYPEMPALRVAEAERRLTAAAGRANEAAPQWAMVATRAHVAALLAGDSPGAADARARALDVTRWLAVRHAENAAGSRKDAQVGILGDSEDARTHGVRAALAAPWLDPSSALWLGPGQIARAVIATRHPVDARVETTCAELRPRAAARWGAAPPCRISIRVGGIDRPAVGGSVHLGRLPRGVHPVDVVLAPGGAEVVSAVRLLLDRHVKGAVPLPERERTWLLLPQVDLQRWIAEPSAPVVLEVLGPTILRIEALVQGKATSVPLAVEEQGQPIATFLVSPSGTSRLIPLPEERRYRLALRPKTGKVALRAQVRVDQARPWAKLALHPGTAASPVAIPDGPPPVPPDASLRVTAGDGAPGTFTLSTLIRDGALGERDTVTERGGRYAQATLTYRRRRGRTWLRADGFGRLRTSGDPSGGMSARVYSHGVDLARLEGGILGIAQGTPEGVIATGWLDGRISSRLRVGESWFLRPSLGGRLRIGVRENPGGDALDPDAWSPYDAAHPRALIGEMRLDYEPFLDLRVHGRARGVTNADGASLDHAGLRVGLDGTLAHLAYAMSFEVERRFADDDRPRGRTRPVLRLEVSQGIWRQGLSRLLVFGAVAVRPGERSDVHVGLSHDWTFGRGLRDYAPPELPFASLLGPGMVPIEDP